MFKRSLTGALIAAAAFIAIPIAPAGAIDDPLVAAARASGAVGEQADGYLGAVPGADVSDDLGARIEQINIQRRAYFAELAEQNNASVNEMAAAIACRVFGDRVALGERYRDEAGIWRQHTAAEPVLMPSFCGS